MATPFETRRSRRFGGLVLLWAVVVSGIIGRRTAVPSGATDVVLGPGSVYYQVRAALVTFAETATAGQTVVLTTYALLGLVVVTLSVYILDVYAFESQDYVRSLVYDYDRGNFLSAVLVLYSFVGLSLLMLLAVLALYTGQNVVTAAGPTGVLDLDLFGSVYFFFVGVSPQFLTLAAFSLVIAFVASLIP